MSCVMIFLDGERYIDEAIASVAGQIGFDDWELVLVDDGSTDAGTAIAKRWAASDPDRIRYLEHAGHANLGMSASRNAGVDAARGRYVGFLDCDDVWLPCMLAHCARVLAGHPDADVVIGGTWYWHGWTGKEADIAMDHLGKLPACPLRSTIEPPNLLAAIWGTPEALSVPAMCSLLVRREAVRGFGGLDAAFRGLYEDQVLYTKLALHTRAVIDPRPISLYRQHPGSICSASIAAGTWRPDGPSEPEFRFWQWMLAYVESMTGASSREAALVRANIDHHEHWIEPPDEEPPPWLRRHAPDWMRTLVRRVRGLASPDDPISVLAEWSEQFLRAAVAAMRGSILVVIGTGRRASPGSTSCPMMSGRQAQRSAGSLCAVSADRRPSTMSSCRSAPEPRWALSGWSPNLLASCAREGTAVVLTRESTGIVGLVRDHLPHARTTIETFGNTATAQAVADGVAAEGLGVALDRHDPALPVMAAITIERGRR